MTETADRPMVVGKEVNGNLRHHLLAVVCAMPGISPATVRELLAGRPDLGPESRLNLWAGSDWRNSIQGYVRGGWVTRDTDGGLHPTTRAVEWIARMRSKAG